MSFFTRIFGFKEVSYPDTQSSLMKLYDATSNTIAGIHCGNFVAKSLISPQFTPRKNGTVTLNHVYGDVRKYINEFPRSVFQTASQTNCLEMINEEVTPEQGISIYENDRTQGPICAIAAPTATAYRNYLLPQNNQIGQTANIQLNILDDFYQTIISHMASHTKLYSVKNGYVMFENNEKLKLINNILLQSPEIRRNLRSKIKVGIHSNVGVVDYTLGTELHLITQVFCSGLPISYNAHTTSQLWYGFAEIILEAMYENTLLVASFVAPTVPCFLTLVGGGVFGMEHSQIQRAIQRACNIVALQGYSLDVRIIHYSASSISAEYEKLPVQYPLNNPSCNSIFDDAGWILLNM